MRLKVFVPMVDIPKHNTELRTSMGRRPFVIGSLVAMAAAASGLLFSHCRRMDHDHNEEHMEGNESRRDELKKMLKRAAEFRENPKKWWAAHREDLLVSSPQTYGIECVDEGDDLDKFLPAKCHTLPKNFDVISVPGSGVNYPGFAEDLRTLVGTEHLMGVTSHKDCGACHGKDDLAVSHARQLAGALQVPYLGHVDTLQRPDYHVALGSNLRYTKKVKNIRFVEDAPRYFDATQWCLSDRRARVENIRLMLNIAYHHGFNELFLEEKIPFELVVWYDRGDPVHTKDSAADEIQEAFRGADLPEELRNTKGLLKLTFMEVR